MSASRDDEVHQLHSKLKEAEENMQKAAQYGLKLLDGQLDLENKLEEQRIEMTNTVETLEQEKYSLQREVELKSRMLDSLRSDYETVKRQQRLQLEQQESQLERNHTLELNDCKNQMERMRAELEEAQLNEKQLRHKLALQTETLSNKMEELRMVTERANETMSSEMMELQLERMELESVKADLERKLQEAQYKEQQLELTNKNFQRQLERLTGEKEEREREAVSCFNALEKAREANQDLQIQLDQVLQQAQDPNSKGNSLFGELEDKRAMMERQLISMKVQHQSLQKQHAFSKQQLHRMKVQIATLMQLQGSRADPAQLERLHSMLSEKNCEIQTLMIKLRHLEEMENTLKAQPSCATPVEADSGDGTYYTDLLKMQLSNSAKEIEQLGDELSMQRMKSLSESQRALELERKLFSAERNHKQSQSDNIKLQVNLEELKMKYEPNEMNKKRIQKRKREKLPVDLPVDIPELKKEEPMILEMEHMQKETEADAHPCPEGRPAIIPLQPPKSPKPNPVLPRDSKCVRISEEPPTTIPNHPRSPPADCKIKTEEVRMMEEVGEENRKDEKKKKLKSQEVIHVTSQKTMENQCAQQ